MLRNFLTNKLFVKLYFTEGHGFRDAQCKAFIECLLVLLLKLILKEFVQFREIK